MIEHIDSGETGLEARGKLNEVIDIVNNLGGTAQNTGLLSDFIYFQNVLTNPSAPDYDIKMFAYYGMLRWIVNGNQYAYDLTANGYDIVIDEFTGLATESRIDLIYTIAPPDIEIPSTFILVRKGTDAVTPVAPALNTGEVFLGYAFVNTNGIYAFQNSGILTISEIFNSFFGSQINGSRQITITHNLNRLIYDICLLKNNKNIDKSNFSFENLDTTQVKITCNFPYQSTDEINYKLS